MTLFPVLACERSQLAGALLIVLLLIAGCGAPVPAIETEKPGNQRNGVGEDTNERDLLRTRLDKLERELAAESKRIEANLKETEAVQKELHQATEMLEKQRAEVLEQTKRATAAIDDAVAGAKRIETTFREVVADLEKRVETLKKERDDTLIEAIRMADNLETATREWVAIRAVADQRGKVLLTSLKASDPAVRRWGAESLGDLGTVGKFALAELERAKGDNDPSVSAAAAAAIAKIQSAGKQQLKAGKD